MPLFPLGLLLVWRLIAPVCCACHSSLGAETCAAQRETDLSAFVQRAVSARIHKRSFEVDHACNGLLEALFGGRPPDREGLHELCLDNYPGSVCLAARRSLPADGPISFIAACNAVSEAAASLTYVGLLERQALSSDSAGAAGVDSAGMFKNGFEWEEKTRIDASGARTRIDASADSVPGQKRAVKEKKENASDKKDDASETAPTAATYASAGITGVTADNVNAIDACLAIAGPTDPNEIQSAVATCKKALQMIGDHLADPTSNPAPTASDYASAGIPDVTAGNVGVIHACVVVAGPTIPSRTVTECKTALEVIANYLADTASNPAPTATDYASAGIPDVTADTVDAINACVVSAEPSDPSQIQSAANTCTTAFQVIVDHIEKEKGKEKDDKTEKEKGKVKEKEKGTGDKKAATEGANDKEEKESKDEVKKEAENGKKAASKADGVTDGNSEKGVGDKKALDGGGNKDAEEVGADTDAKSEKGAGDKKAVDGADNVGADTDVNSDISGDGDRKAVDGAEKVGADKDGNTEKI